MCINSAAARTLVLLTILGVVSCDRGQPSAIKSEQENSTGADVFVQLFEWHWNDIATECEQYLGSAGYKAAQVSPPQEHIVGPAWWTRYQPVSYQLESRSGTRDEFADMVSRCAKSGVDIYVDALTNHMASIGSGVGVAGSSYGEFSYPVPYDFDDFHHCGRYDDDVIRDYQDLWEIQNCTLGQLADLDTGNPAVRKKIAVYLNDLLSLGVAGFRLDAAKHISHEDIGEIIQLLDGAAPLIFQEVIDRGGEPINAYDYLGNGSVIEFKFPMAIVDAFEKGDIESLKGFDSAPGYLPSDKAIVFVDNHDLQRGHAGSDEVVNYQDGARYELSVAFMLAYPYGYPMVMSSYDFSDPDQGPPSSSPLDATDGCGADWVCEHRRPAIANMVIFRRATAGSRVTHWAVTDGKLLSFGRGDKGHIAINTGIEAMDATIETELPPGQYCNVVSNEDCENSIVVVAEDKTINVSLAPQSMIAIHSGAEIASRTESGSTRQVRIDVRVPDGTPSVYITGNADTLGPWNPQAVKMVGDGAQRSTTIAVPDGYKLEYRFTLGNWDQKEIGLSGEPVENHRLDVQQNQNAEHDLIAFTPDPAERMADWRNSGVLGTLVYWPDVASKYLSKTHHVEVWLPPGYDDDPDRSYKVIYMHDGQNLFDPRLAEDGNDWRVDEAIVQGVTAGDFESAIVVGIWNSSDRFREYSPWDLAPQFGQFIIEEVMPRVNAEFRTLIGPDNTFVMGSSMGGLLSFFLVKEHPDVFGACGCMSSHFYLSDAFLAMAVGKDPASADSTPYIVRDIRNGYPPPTAGRFFFDFGTEGLDAEYGPSHAVLHDWLIEHEFKEGKDFIMREYPGAGHDSISWHARLGDQLKWLLNN